MKCPAEVYQPSPRPYTGLPDIDYSLHDKTIVVTRCGSICLGRKKINFSQVFAGQAVGITEVQDDIWLVSFMDYDLGYFDLETRVLEPLENPFGPKVFVVSPMSPGWTSKPALFQSIQPSGHLIMSFVTGTVVDHNRSQLARSLPNTAISRGVTKTNSFFASRRA
jgi:hypothetical protein